MDVSIECELKGVTRTDEDGHQYMAMVLPSTCTTVKGSVTNGENSYDDDDLILSDQYGNCLSISGIENIEALAGFLLVLVDQIRARDAGLEDEIPEDAKVGAMSEGEIESMFVPEPPVSAVERNPGKFDEGEVIL